MNIKRVNPALSTTQSNPRARKGGVNRACRYFPCHKGLEDCTFCYCPFYPCMDEKLGRLVKGNIWSCRDCSWIHKRKIVDEIFVLIRQNKKWIKKLAL